jgi:outer membrane protein TolC
MKKTKKIISTFILLIGLISCAKSQNVLDTYVQQAITNNESIKQQQFLLEKNMYALKEAKSLFLPTISLNGLYTKAQGGRTIDFPIGDLLNPAYNTLNQLTASNSFPQFQNQSILINPDNFYDAKLHTTLPIINAEIWYNKKIKEKQYDLQNTEVTIYKRELIKDVKIAYFKYLQSSKAIEIYENALKLVKENLRVNTSLYNNQKINQTALIRSNNEVIKIETQLESAKQNQKSAKEYFNFLINVPLYTDIIADSTITSPELIIQSDETVTKREELFKLNQAKDLNLNVIALSKSYRIPKLNSFLDLGSQGFDYDVNDKTRYYFFGLSLEWNLFSFGKNIYKTKQTVLDDMVIQSQIKNVEQQLKLQLDVATNGYYASMQQYQSYQSQVNTSSKYYSDMFLLYKQGQALFIELLDAQNQLLNSQLQENISIYDTWIKRTEIERANASFIIK